MHRKNYFNFIEKILFKLSNKFLSDYLFSYFSLKKWDSAKPSLKKPRSFNEKLRYIALFDRRPIYTCFADKLESKKLVESIIGSSVVTPTLKVWGDPQRLSFDELPDKFVLKTNHNNGDVLIINDKNKVSLEEVKAHFGKALNKDHYRSGREWSYKNIRRFVFAEEVLPIPKEAIVDYKFFCFNGAPRFIQVDSSRFENHKRDFYDLEWNLLDWKFGYSNSQRPIRKPDGLSRMIEISERLSCFFPFCRIDLYSIPGDSKANIRFGEATFYPEGACKRFQPEELNASLGEWIDIGSIKFSHRKKMPGIFSRLIF